MMIICLHIYIYKYLYIVCRWFIWLIHILNIQEKKKNMPKLSCPIDGGWYAHAFQIIRVAQDTMNHFRGHFAII